MKLTRLASLIAFTLLALPASLWAGNHAANKVGTLKSPPAVVEEQITCTSYPEWTCFPSSAPAKPETAEERAARELEASRAAGEKPACISYPEFTCLPGSTEGQKAEVQPVETTADASQPAAADVPACTSYPEWTCFPQVNEAQTIKAAQAKQTTKRNHL